MIGDMTRDVTDIEASNAVNSARKKAVVVNGNFAHSRNPSKTNFIEPLTSKQQSISIPGKAIRSQEEDTGPNSATFNKLKVRK